MTNVTVLYGGKSLERDVSLVSGKAVANTLQEEGFSVTLLDYKDDDILNKIVQSAPDIVFNALHGRWGEDGCIQGALEILGIKYTHSGVLASSIAMDKTKTKTLVSTVGVKSPEGQVVTGAQARSISKRPIVVKPNNEGSSINVNILLTNKDHVPEAVLDTDIVLVEDYISGREFTVTVMDNQTLPITEVSTDHAFFDYNAKYIQGSSLRKTPAPISDELYERISDQAVKVHNLLGCKGVTRSDFIYNPESDTLLFYEINTQPGLTPTSLMPAQAKYKGISFAHLCRWIVEDGLK